MPKPGLPKLTKQNMEGSPEEKWVDSIEMVVNETVNQIESLRSENSGVQLLKNADVEDVELDVEIPDPWISAVLENSWAGVFRYMKHPSGLVEVRFVLDGTAATGGQITTLPVGYKPAHDVYGFAVDASAVAAAYVNIQQSGGTVSGSLAEIAGSFLYLPSDSTPIPASCWPKFVSTKFAKVSAVFVAAVFDGASTSPLPAGAVYSPVWETTTMAGEINVKLLNIAGLPYNRKSRIRLLIVGG